MVQEPKVIEHAGAIIDLSKVKCFKLNQFTDVGTPNILTIEFKSRIEYVWNPNSTKFEKEVINDKTEIEFPSYDSAKAYSREFEEIWQDYLES